MKDNALYLEVDEDITSAIDKLTKSPGNSVQIVVPKRSTMLQSIINLKLLKKAAENHGKELVLVTNDRIANDLASRVGLAVAPSLGAKPVIKEAEVPEDLKSNEEFIDADDPEPPAPAPEPKVKASAKRLLMRRKEVSEGPPAPPPPTPEPASTPDDASDAPVAATKKSPKVPNFNRLQRRVMWAGLAVALVLGYLAFMNFFASAKVTLYANGTKVDIDTTFSADPNLSQTDKSKSILAAQLVTVSKDLSGSFTPTGKKDVGTKAHGTITVKNEYDTDTHPLQQGTRFVAPDGKQFRTTADVVVPGLTVAPGPVIVAGSVTVDVVADESGDAYNEGPARYTIPGYSGAMQTKIYGQGAQMSGGTTKTVTVVTQADVDGAKTDLLAKDKDNVARDLKSRAPSGYVALDSSQATATPTVSPAPAVDAEGSTATLTVKVTYTVLAVKQSEYQEMVRSQELKQIGDQNQVYDDGLDGAQVTASEKDASGRQNFHLTTEAYGGAKLDTGSIASQLKGKKFGDASDIANRLPGITKADISLSPGWATSMPNRPGKININIQVAAAKK